MSADEFWPILACMYVYCGIDRLMGDSSEARLGPEEARRNIKQVMTVGLLWPLAAVLEITKDWRLRGAAKGARSLIKCVTWISWVALGGEAAFRIATVVSDQKNLVIPLALFAMAALNFPLQLGKELALRLIHALPDGHPERPHSNFVIHQ